MPATPERSLPSPVPEGITWIDLYVLLAGSNGPRSKGEEALLLDCKWHQDNTSS